MRRSRFARALATFVLLAVPASAETPPPTCDGRDLLALARTEEAKAYSGYEREAAAIPNGEGLLWRVERAGQAPSYLFGTMHMTDPRITELPPVVANALGGSRTVALELASTGDRQAMAREGATLVARAVSERAVLVLTDEDDEHLSRALAARGLPVEAAGRLQPWFLALSLAYSPCELKRQAAGAEVVDERVANLARSKKIKVVGLETLDEQIDALSAIDPSVVRDVVADSARLSDKINDINETMVRLYRDRRIGMLLASMELMTQSPRGLRAGRAFIQALTVRRNRTMHERALPLITKGNAFVAVGALHLMGEQGLVELFRRSGHQVTRVW
jgi:uncharacterized protein YbaP (TraB family)